MRLNTLTTQEATLTHNAQSTMTTGHQDAARAFALQLAGVREQIQTLSAQIPQLEEAANQAKQVVQESTDQLQTKVNERGQILAQIDQVEMQRELNESLKSVSDLTGSQDVPSFDAIKAKVQSQFAEASAASRRAWRIGAPQSGVIAGCLVGGGVRCWGTVSATVGR